LALVSALRSPSTSLPATVWLSRSSEAKCGPEYFGDGAFSVVRRLEAPGEGGSAGFIGGALLSLVPGRRPGRQRWLTAVRSSVPGAGAGTALPPGAGDTVPVEQQAG